MLPLRNKECVVYIQNNLTKCITTYSGIYTKNSWDKFDIIYFIKDLQTLAEYLSQHKHNKYSSSIYPINIFLHGKTFNNVQEQYNNLKQIKDFDVPKFIYITNILEDIMGQKKTITTHDLNLYDWFVEDVFCNTILEGCIVRKDAWINITHPDYKVHICSVH
jgi:hypothetical protein